jgi:hypothetical protein
MTHFLLLICLSCKIVMLQNSEVWGRVPGGDRRPRLRRGARRVHISGPAARVARVLGGNEPGRRLALAALSCCYIVERNKHTHIRLD